MATASRSKLFCDQVITDKDEDKGQQEVHELSLNVCRLQGYRLLFFLLFSFSFPFFFSWVELQVYTIPLRSAIRPFRTVLPCTHRNPDRVTPSSHQLEAKSQHSCDLEGLGYTLEAFVFLLATRFFRKNSPI